MEDDGTSRQDQYGDCNIAVTWAPDRKRRRGRPTPPGGERLKRKGQKRDGDRGRK